MKKKIFASLILIILVFSFSGCGCKTKNPKFGLKLEIWGIIDEQDSFGEIFENYTKLNPLVKEIVFRKFTPETYKKELIDALATGKGPDIFMINSTWEPSFRNKIAPAPEEVLTEKMFRDNFVDLASDAFVVEGKVNAVPLSADSLALYYNKDLLAEAGIANPPRTWEELISISPKLTKIDSYGQINYSAISMGAAYNVNRSTDILGLLMLQLGVKMEENNGGVVLFGGYSGDDSLAEKAFDFYTNFSQRDSSLYTWNPSLHWSLDAFAEGRTAMMLNYSWHIPTIRNKSPKLNFTVAPAPQFVGYPKINFGNCYGYAVAVNKKPEIVGEDAGSVNVKDESRIRETWKFLRYLTMGYLGEEAGPASIIGLGGKFDSNLDPAQVYLETTKKPAARRDLIEKQKGIYELGVFAEENLSARNWKQLDPDAIESIMGEMIDNVNRGKFNIREALDSAVTRINQAIKK